MLHPGSGRARQELCERIEECERCLRIQQLHLRPLYTDVQPEGAQVGAGLRDRHRELVGADRTVLLPLEEEHAALLQIGGEQIEPSDETHDLLLVLRFHQLFAKAAQERTLGGKDRLQFLGQVSPERQGEQLSADRVLCTQEGMGALQCTAREGELPLSLMQEPQILLPEESAAVDLHARGACIASGFIPLQR